MAERRYALPESLTGDQIRGLRRRLKLTQQQFADLLQMSKTTVAHWESGEGRITGPAVLAAKMLLEDPETAERLTIPEKTMPLRLLYYCREFLCTVIDTDERMQRVQIRNYTRWPQYRAFGVNTEPTWEDYQEFLRSRCFPEQRDMMKLELKKLGLPFYDPLMIIEKTQGRMAEDDFWLAVER